MRLSTYRGVGLAACLGLASLSLARAETLADAWRLALQNDAGLGAARSEVAAAESARTAAARARFPVLDATGSYTQFKNAPSLDVATPGGGLQAPIWKRDGYAAAAVDVSAPLCTSGRISGVIGAANAGLYAARAQELRSTADLKLAVAEAYVAVFRARRALAVAESNVASLRANAEDEIAVPVFDRALEISRAGARMIAKATRVIVGLGPDGRQRAIGRPGQPGETSRAAQ